MTERTGESKRHYDNSETITWAGLQTGDVGEWRRIPFLNDKTVQVSGTPGTPAGSITWQGTNEENPDESETVVFTLSDVLGAGGSASLIAPPDGLVLAENPLWFRPIVIAGQAGVTTLKAVAHAVGRRAGQ